MITPSLPIPGVSGCDVPAAPVDQFQIETTCVAENSNLYIIETNQAVTPPTVKIFDFAGTDVTGTVTPIVCPGAKHDVEESCYQDIADPFIKYTRANIYDVAVTPPVLSGTIWLDGAGAVIAAPVNVEACSDPSGNQVVSQNYIQLDNFGMFTGGLVTETKTYDSDGVLISTVYTDTVTGVVVALQPGTQQLAPVVGTKDQFIEMCDSGTTTFLRELSTAPGGQLLGINDFLPDGTPYVSVGPVTIGACAVNTLPIVQCESIGITNTILEPISNTYNGVIAPLAGPTGDLTTLGNSADGIIIDGVDWTFNIPITRVNNFYISDQEGAISITDNLANICPFSSTIVWDEPTDPTGNTFAATVVSEITTCLTTLGIPFSTVTETHSIPGPGQLNIEFSVNDTNNIDMPLWLSTLEWTNGTTTFSTDNNPFEVNYQFSSALTGTLSSITVEVVATIAPGTIAPMGVFIGGVFGDGGMPFTFMNGTGTQQTYQYNVPLTGIDIFAGAYTLTVADLSNFQTWIFGDGTDNFEGIVNVDGVRVIVGIEEAVSNDSVLTSICNTDDISDFQVTSVDAQACVLNGGFVQTKIKTILDTVYDKGVKVSESMRHVDVTTGLPYVLNGGDTVEVCEQLMVPYGAIVTMLEFVTGLTSTSRIFSISIVGSGPTIPPYKVSFDGGASWSTFYAAHSWGDGETLTLDVTNMVIDVVNPGDQIEVVWEK